MRNLQLYINIGVITVTVQILFKFTDMNSS